MRNIDPDVLQALKTLAARGEAYREQRIRGKQAKQLDAEIETKMQLLTDEVSRVIPTTHPLFESVLLLAVLHKVAKQQQEPHYTSSLEDFPQGW